MYKVFDVIKCVSTELVEPNVIVATDENNKKSLLLTTKVIDRDIENKLKLTIVSSKNLFEACKQAWKVLLEYNTDSGNFGEKYCVVQENRLVSWFDVDYENIDDVIKEVEFLNTLCNNASIVKKVDSILEIKANRAVAEDVKDELLFIDIILDFDKPRFSLYTGREVTATIYPMVYPAITGLMPIFEENTDFNEILSNRFISEEFSVLNTEYGMLKDMIAPEKLFMGCTADLIISKLKKFKIKTKTDKHGMLADIDNIDIPLVAKMIESINATNEKFKTISKAKDIIIPEENIFTVVELIVFFTYIYYIGGYKLTMKDLYDFIISLDEEASPNLCSVEL